MCVFKDCLGVVWRLERRMRNTQSLVSHYFFRFRLQPSLSDSSQPGTAVSAEASRRLHLEVSSRDASSKETWRLGEFSKVLVARASGHHPLGALGSMVPARANQVVRFKWGSHPSIKGTCPYCLNPSPVIHGSQAWSGSRDWKAA